MSTKAYDYMDWPRIEGVIYGEESSPRDVFAPRITCDGILLQGFFPDARKAEVLAEGKTYEMEMEDEAGYFAALLPLRKIPSYHFQVTWEDQKKTFADPYAFPSRITEDEEKAFLAGVWYDSYKKLGAHPMVLSGVDGTYFAVWAPNAERVSLVGDFVRWDGRYLPMHRSPMSGIFELFVPGIAPDTIYKYEIRTKGGHLLLKSDPYGFMAEEAPGDASVVAELPDYSWTDQEWIRLRSRFSDHRQAMSIYETSLTDWNSAEDLIRFVKETGYTHVELHPVMEYLDEATDGYSTTSYYAVTRRFGTPEDFCRLVDLLHHENIGVLLDWTPAQFPKNEAGLVRFDGTPLYEIADPSFNVHPMWGTMLYNYGSPIVTDFLLSNACFWCETYHADGLRLDDVDAMLYLDYGRKDGEYRLNYYGTNENLDAIEFIKHLNSILHKKYPGLLVIAQEDGLWPQLTGSVEEDHLGFDYKWSGGWTSDLLQYLAVDPILRKNYHDQLTLSMLYAYSERYILTLAQRDVGSLASFRDRLWGDADQKAAQLREAYAYMMVHPGCKMASPDASMPEGLRAMVHDLNTLYTAQPALHLLDNEYEGFDWIQLMAYDENVLVFTRRTDKPEETLLVICNFAAISYPAYQTGVPFYGKYKEIFNSDSLAYGGSDFTNPRAKTPLRRECDEREYSIKVKLPALGLCIFSCSPSEVKEPVPKKESRPEPAAKKESQPAKAAAEKKKQPAKAAAEKKKQPAKAAAEKKKQSAKAAGGKKTDK